MVIEPLTATWMESNVWQRKWALAIESNGRSVSRLWLSRKI